MVLFLWLWSLIGPALIQLHYNEKSGILCNSFHYSTKERIRFGTTWGWGNYEWIFVFGWTIHLKVLYDLDFRHLIVLDFDFFLFIRIAVWSSPMRVVGVCIPESSTPIMTCQHISSPLETLWLHAVILNGEGAHPIPQHGFFGWLTICKVWMLPLSSIQPCPTIIVFSQERVHQGRGCIRVHLRVIIGGLCFFTDGISLFTHRAVNHGKDFRHEGRAQIKSEGVHGVRRTDGVWTWEGRDTRVRERASVDFRWAGWGRTALGWTLSAGQSRQGYKARLQTCKTKKEERNCSFFWVWPTEGSENQYIAFSTSWTAA